jgi:hypothetical protein
MAQNAIVLATRYFVGDLLGGIVAFPFWWYTLGLRYLLGWSGGLLKLGSRYLAVGIWFRNLFVPMYGETTVSGRIISFFVRLAMIVFRGLGLAVFSLLVLTLLLVYLAILPLAVLGLLFNLGGMTFG